MKMDLKVYSEEEMQKLGGNLASVLGEGDVVYLLGELGAGKTALVRGAARGLGYKGPVTSPTFTLMNVYETAPIIYHFDFYRLEGSDLVDLGLEDYMEQGGIAMIEWPQVGEGFLPQEALWLQIDLTDDDYDRERIVHIRAKGKKYQEKLERLRQIVNLGNR
jgi:tRNA threonylcarbamoyladenosine biosynthesis protein TsaE